MRNPAVLLLGTSLLSVARPTFGFPGPPASSQAASLQITEATQARDRQVLEALLLFLHADSRLDLTSVRASRGTIVLHHQTPDTGTAFIQPAQLTRYLEGHRLPAPIRQDLVRRNVRPGTYETYQRSFASLRFPAQIEVADLSGKMNSRTFAFSEAYPRARGWVEAFLPGYSTDGDTAAVRAWIGPSVHGALVTALLTRRGGAWRVVWRALARFD